MPQPGKCSNAGARNVASGLLAALFLLVPRLGGAVTAGGNEWTGWDPGTVVEINLQRGRITESLPFDVPFYLLSKPPEPLVPKLDPVAFVAANPRSAPACDENRLPTEFCEPYPTDSCRVPITKVKEKVNNTGDPVDQIEISMPQLSPKMDYCVVVAMPREPSAEEKKLMLDIAEARLRIAATTVASREVVLTADWVSNVCEETKASIESALRERKLTLIPRQGSALRDCQAGAIEALYGELVSGTSVGNLAISLAEAELALAALKDVIGANDADPRLKQIRSLASPEKRLEYLGFPPALPRLLSKEQVTRWTIAVASRKTELEKDWKNRQTDLTATCNDRQKTLGASAVLRMRCFAASELDAVATDLGSVAAAQAKAGDDVDRLLKSLAPDIVASVAVGATTWAQFEQRFRWYVSADMGFAHAWDIDESFAYTGVNFYFSPVNKRAPLNGLGVRQQFSRRFALIIGLPTPSLEDPSRKPLVAGKPLLVGTGVRLNDYLRLTVGGLVFDETDPDPLVDDTRGLKATPFASLSLDINLVGIFTGFFTPR
jgi:hypothetical protein